MDATPSAGIAGASPAGGTTGLGGAALAGTTEPQAGLSAGGSTQPSAGTLAVAGSPATAGNDAGQGGAGGETDGAGAGGISSGAAGVSGAGGGLGDAGSAGMGGAQVVNGCSEFVDGSTEKALRDLPWTEVLATEPARCLRIQSGQSVIFRGSFADHPLAPFGGDEPSPIVPFDGIANRIELSFAMPGLFGFICTVHPEMTGAILVEP